MAAITTGYTDTQIREREHLWELWGVFLMHSYFIYAALKPVWSIQHYNEFRENLKMQAILQNCPAIEKRLRRPMSKQQSDYPMAIEYDRIYNETYFTAQ
jgi:hypothetical protein